MEDVKRPAWWLWLCCLSAGLIGHVTAQSAVNVTQYHNHISRDGLYVDPAFTYASASNLTRDLSFSGVISGNVYAQPLYIEGNPTGQAMIIAVTESNNVYALDAGDGTIIWQDHAGAPVPLANLPCGNIDPLGITGTPVVDLPTRSLFFDAMTTPDNGNTKKHLIFSVNVDTGLTNSGWPVYVDAAAVSSNSSFTSYTQNERGALADFNGMIYVPYGGHYGDCMTYHGWIVGVPVGNPASVTAWATSANQGGAWSVGGVAGDGTNLFLATGNTGNTGGVWSGGEAIIRFQPGPVFSGLTNDYWSPTDWVTLDNMDWDIGGTGPLIVDVPGANPSNLVVALGKDKNAYLLNRNNLGGITAPVAVESISSSEIVQAAATYRTASGTYVVFNGNGNNLVTFRITPTSPPTIQNAWAESENGRGSPFVTSTDGTNNMVVWGIGAETGQRLYGFNGDTGATVFNGGGANELMANTRHFQTAIAARGRIYVGTDNQVFAFTVPVPPIHLTNSTVLPNGVVQFSFTNTPGLSFTAFTTTNVGARISPTSVRQGPGHGSFSRTIRVHQFARC